MYYKEYPNWVQAVFEKYYQRLRDELTWNKVLPKFFKKNQLKSVSGAKYVHCPFHGERTASMRFSSRMDIFHCYGCGIGGTPFRFIVKMEGGVLEAMLFIRKHFQIPLPFSRKEWRAVKREMMMQEMRLFNQQLHVISIDDWDASFEIDQDDLDELELQRINFELSCVDPRESFFDPRDERFFTRCMLFDNSQADQLVTWQRPHEKKEFPRLDLSSMSLKKLILVRHGEYDRSLSLSPTGYEQMKGVVCEIGLLDLKKYGSSLLVVSTTKRAMESGDVLEAGLSFDERSDLSIVSDESYNTRDAFAMLLAQGKEYTSVVIVSHLPFCESFSVHVANNIMGIKHEAISLSKGGFCIFDFEENTITYR